MMSSQAWPAVSWVGRGAPPPHRLCEDHVSLCMQLFRSVSGQGDFSAHVHFFSVTTVTAVSLLTPDTGAAHGRLFTPNLCEDRETTSLLTLHITCCEFALFTQQKVFCLSGPLVVMI